MGKEEEIKEELTEIWYTLLDAKTSFYYAEYLFNPPSKKEVDYMQHYGVEMTFFRNVLWGNAIIKLANMFKKKEKRSIEKFLNKVDGGGPFSKHIPSQKVQELRFKLASFQGIIQKVLVMRDEVFAHADKRYVIARQYNIFDKDIEKLILFTENFISEIFLIFDCAVVHDDSKLLKEEFNILEILSDYEDERHTKIIDKFKNIKKE